MKKLLLLAGLALSAAPAFAIDAVYETAKGSASVTNVTLSSNSVTQVDNSVRLLTERFVIEIWNDDAALSAFCGFNSSVSSNTASSFFGRRVGPRSAWSLAVPKLTQGIYCVGDTGAPQVVLTQLW